MCQKAKGDGLKMQRAWIEPLGGWICDEGNESERQGAPQYIYD